MWMRFCFAIVSFSFFARNADALGCTPLIFDVMDNLCPYGIWFYFAFVLPLFCGFVFLDLVFFSVLARH